MVVDKGAGLEHLNPGILGGLFWFRTDKREMIMVFG